MVPTNKLKNKSSLFAAAPLTKNNELSYQKQIDLPSKEDKIVSKKREKEVEENSLREVQSNPIPVINKAPEDDDSDISIHYKDGGSNFYGGRPVHIIPKAGTFKPPHLKANRKKKMSEEDKD